MATGHHNSLASKAAGLDRWLGWLVYLAGLLLLAGWTLPLMTVDKLWIFSEQVSIAQGAVELWRAGEILLFVVVAVFSILFPLIKLGVALFLWYGVDAESPALAETLLWIERLGRWSMLDVFVVALTIVVIEVSLVGAVTVHPGIYAFTAAILLSIATVARMTAVAHRVVERGHPPRPRPSTGSG